MGKNDPTYDDYCPTCSERVEDCVCDPITGECLECGSAWCETSLPTGDDLLDKHHAALMARERKP